jgi:multisubunit Na+/H+ antiporter MnhG subunit
MRLKKSRKEYSDTWLQTASLIISLVFTLLAAFGVLTSDQVAQSTPLIATTLGAVSTVIAGVIQLIGIFFKKDDTV